MGKHLVPSILSTARLTLRVPRSADVDPCVQRWCDPQVMRYMGGPRDPQKLRDAMQDSFDEESRADAPARWWTVVETVTDKSIGDVGLIDKQVDGEPETELVYIFDRDRWRQGYASEAAAAMLQAALSDGRYERIISLTDEDHIASQRVALKAGMTFHKKTVRPVDGADGRIMFVYVSQQSASD